jgi:hypothetical protein
MDAYIAKAPEYARPICEKLRAMVRKAAPELTEAIKWGSPTWVGKGLVCGMAAFKAHVSFHFFKGAHVEDPEGVFQGGEDNAAMRSLKFTSVKDIAVKPLERLVRAAAKLDASPGVKAAPRAKRPELPMPADFAAAIKKEPKASAYWKTLPPSCRREYIEWIVTAKREETRTRRLSSAVDMLHAGRRRNEEYR